MGHGDLVAAHQHNLDMPLLTVAFSFRPLHDNLTPRGSFQQEQAKYAILAYHAFLVLYITKLTNRRALSSFGFAVLPSRIAR